MTAGAVIVALLVVLGAGAAVFGGSSSSKATGHTADPAVRVARIAHRVEELRGLRFRRPVRPRIVSPARARAEGVADLDRSEAPSRRHADEEVLELLGLLPPGADLRKLLGTAFGEQVAGYYDPRTKRLSVVRGPAAGTKGTLGDITLAHELTHALEDQRFGIRDATAGTDDRATAHTALVEGTATAVMLDYARRFLSSGALLSDALGSLGAPQTKLPRYVQDSLEFPYVTGVAFVGALRARAGGWGLVNAALRSRPPASSEQVLHPGKWFARERPLPVRIEAQKVLRRPPWRRVATGGLGEWDTSEVLAGGIAKVDATAAARGWGGGRYELWQRRRSGGCRAPCRARDGLVLAWRWDTARDAREFHAALVTWLAAGLRARPAGRDAWTLDGAALHVRSRPRATTLAMAPGAALAARLAR